MAKSRFSVLALLPAIIAGAGIALSVLAAKYIDAGNRVAAEQRFESLSAKITEALQSRVTRYEYGLRGARGLFVNNPDAVSLQMFRRYIASRQSDEEFPGSMGFGVIEHVKPERRAAFEHRARDAIAPDFAIKQLGPVEGANFVIKFIEPEPLNLLAIGLDIASEQRRREAALAAMSSGHPVITAPVTLVQDNKKLPGFLYLLPIYRPDMPIATADERASAIWGWVYTPLRIDLMLEGVVSPSDTGIDLHIHDVNSGHGDQPIFDSDDSLSKARPDEEDWRTYHRPIMRQVSLLVGDRLWHLDMTATPAFFANLNLMPAWIVGAMGTAISLLLAGIVWSQQGMQRRASHLAQRMTASLRESEQRVELAINAAGLGLWDWNIATGEANYHRQWAEMLGYLRQELQPWVTVWESLVHPDDLPGVKAALDNTFRGLHEIFQHDFRMRCKGGEWKWIRSIGRVSERDEHGNPLRMQGAHLDIDGLMRHEEELQRSLKLHDVIFNHATVGIALTRNRRFERCSERLASMLGYQVSELEGLPGMTIYATDEAYEEVGRIAREALPRGDMLDYETWLRRKDGSSFWGRLYAKAVEPDDQDQGTIWIIDDFTERKQREELFAHAREAAEAASRAKSDFLANVSHEIRTPMNAVLGFASLLLNSTLNDDQQSYVRSIQVAGDALMTLMNDLLDLTKIEAGKMEFEQIDFDLRDLLDDAIDMVAARAADKGLELACLVQPQLPSRVRGDPARLRQILLNLANNAVKFTDAGEVVVRASLGGGADVQRLRFEVSDTGIGIDTDALGRLFQPFTQADASTTRRYGGTGLGLSISRRLIEGMGGRIGVSSELHVGSLFWFELPLLAASSQPEPSPSTSLAGRVVLVCGHTDAGRESLADILTPMGIRVLSCATAAESLTTLREGAALVDCAIIDYRLPDMDGTDLGRAIHQLSGYSGLPLIMLATLAWRGQANEARTASFSAYLTKPVRHEQLIACLNDVLLGLRATHPGGLITSHSLAERLAVLKPRILLAEDNPVNQRIAVLMLEQLGCRVDVADDGLAALKAVQSSRYDMIFMDCQMPNLDGIEATRQIRALDDAVSNLPIVALTANASVATEKECRAAGMNDFVTKPITPESMGRVLQRWVSGHATTPAAEAGAVIADCAEAAAPAPLPGADLDNVRATLDSLASALGADVVPQVLALYRDTTAELIPAIEQASAEADWAQLIRHAHRLKGTAAQIGGKLIAEQCAELEAAARQEDADAVAYFIASINLEVQALDALLDGAPADATLTLAADGEGPA
ncbi:CHASE domain-containing protein [Chitinivorax sp. PXF-14]|uniref:CHASE domain-containing protein n=1 Tax=Chitinivorax sp. PXF-14 TaxID=3230488 RepID=UPI003466CCE3